MPPKQHMAPPSPSQYGMASSIFFAHLPREIFGRRWEPFDYDTSTLPLNAGAANIKAQFTVDASYGFVLGVLNVASVIAGTEETDKSSWIPATIQLGLNSGDLWSADPVHINTIAGTAQRPGYFPTARYLAPSTTVNAILSSLLAAGGNNYNIRLTFRGWHVYPASDS